MSVCTQGALCIGVTREQSLAPFPQPASDYQNCGKLGCSLVLQQDYEQQRGAATLG